MALAAFFIASNNGSLGVVVLVRVMATSREQGDQVLVGVPRPTAAPDPPPDPLPDLKHGPVVDAVGVVPEGQVLDPDEPTADRAHPVLGQGLLVWLISHAGVKPV